MPRSLVTDDMDSIGAAPGSTSRKSSAGADTVKLVAAVVLLALAGGVLAWSFGMFNSGPKVTVTPEENTQYEQDLQEQQELSKTFRPGEA